MNNRSQQTGCYQRDNPLGACDGFTLIEVLVALTLLAVGLVSLIELFSGSLSLAHSSRVYTVATFLANQKMGEILISKEIPSESGFFAPPYDNFSYVVQDDAQDDKWQLEIIDDILSIIGEREQIPSTSALRKVRVTVRWEEGHRKRELSLQTLKVMVISYETEL